MILVLGCVHVYFRQCFVAVAALTVVLGLEKHWKARSVKTSKQTARAAKPSLSVCFSADFDIDFTHRPMMCRRSIEY